MTQTVFGSGPDLTIEKLAAMAHSLPAVTKETWASSRLFPATGAWRFMSPTENLLLAHPSFWLRVERAACQSKPYLATELGLAVAPQTFSGIPIRDLDPWPDDAPEVAAAKIAERQRVVMMIAEATLGPDPLAAL